MKKRHLLSTLFHNDKAMMIASVIAAICIWFSVISGPANIDERSIGVTTTLDMSNTYAYESGLRIIGSSTVEVQVKVSGAWSVISKLTGDDMRVRADFANVKQAGAVEIPLTVTKNSAQTDYDIVSYSPNSVTATVDFWDEGSPMAIGVDVSALSVVDPTTMQLGDPVLDTSAFQNGSLTLQGPRTVVSQVSKLVARVQTPETLSDVKQFQIPITALDKNSNVVDISECSFEEIEKNLVSLTVPVWVGRTVPLTYTTANMPEGFSGRTDLLTLTPDTVNLLGPSSTLDNLGTTIGDIGIINFDTLSLENARQRMALNIPSAIKAADGIKSTLMVLNTDGLASKAVSIAVTPDRVTLKNVANGRTASVADQQIQNVVLVGNAASINAITEANLSVTLDMGQTGTLGLAAYGARIVVNGYDDVWVYYGTSAQSAYPLYVTLS